MSGFQTSINGALWALFILASLAVLGRMVARAKQKRRPYLDDWLMCLSLLLNLVAVILASVAVSHGVGLHITQIEPTMIPGAVYWGLAATNVGLLADTTPKLSVALLMNRLLNLQFGTRIFALGISIILNLIAVILIIVGYEQCQPVSYQWNRATEKGTCLDPNIFANFAIFAGAWSAFVDLFLSIYPLYVVSRLQMARRKKIIAMCLLGLGLLTFAVTMYKTIDQLPQLAKEEFDVTYIIGELILWTIIEASVTIIAGSIPTWGWLLKTGGVERIITWITLHSLGSSRSRSQRLQGSEENLDQPVPGHTKVKGNQTRKIEKQTGSMPLDTIDNLERSAYSS